MAGTLLWLLIFLSIATGCNGGDPGSLDPALADDARWSNGDPVTSRWPLIENKVLDRHPRKYLAIVRED
jgi:hypothetical protein